MILEACLLSCALYYSGLKFFDLENEPEQKKGGGVPPKIGKALLKPAEPVEEDIERLINSPAIVKNKPNDEQVNKYLAVTSVSLFLTSIGTIYYSPLVLFGVAGLAYPLAGIMKRAYRGLVYEKKVKMVFMLFFKI